MQIVRWEEEGEEDEELGSGSDEYVDSGMEEDYLHMGFSHLDPPFFVFTISLFGICQCPVAFRHICIHFDFDDLMRNMVPTCIYVS